MRSECRLFAVGVWAHQLRLHPTLLKGLVGELLGIVRLNIAAAATAVRLHHAGRELRAGQVEKHVEKMILTQSHGQKPHST